MFPMVHENTLTILCKLLLFSVAIDSTRNTNIMLVTDNALFIVAESNNSLNCSDKVSIYSNEQS